MFIAAITVIAFSVKKFGVDDKYVSPLINVDPDVQRPLPDNLLNLEKVKSLATTKAPDTSVTNVKLQNNNGQLVYVVSMETGTQMAFDAQTGAELPDVPASKSSSGVDSPAPATNKDTAPADTDSSTAKDTSIGGSSDIQAPGSTASTEPSSDSTPEQTPPPM